MKLKIKKEYAFSEVGVQEVEGLLPKMNQIIAPIQAAIREHTYWTDAEFTPSEYKSRDGFIPYSHNCGGLDCTIVIPKCEEYEFSHLVDFGECEDCTAEKYCGYEGLECSGDSEGHFDAKFRVWLKFEGIDEDGEMQFYLYAGGGNGDAPYFRTAHEVTIFEASFSAKTIAGIQKAAKSHVQKLVAKIRGKRS